MFMDSTSAACTAVLLVALLFLGGSLNSLHGSLNAVRSQLLHVEELVRTQQQEVQQLARALASTLPPVPPSPGPIPQVQAMTAPVPQPVEVRMTPAIGEPSGLYMGNGKVFCFVRPLGVAMMLEAGDKGITPHLCRGLGWEGENTDVFKRLTKQGDWILELGANVGYFTLMWSQMSAGSGGKVLAVEASPRTYDLVSTTIELLGLLKSYGGPTELVNKAIWDKAGETVHISVMRDRTLNNRVQAGGGDGTVPVQTTTVDSLVADWPRLDFIKIDVEGAEEHAYKGMSHTIQRFRDSGLTIVMECNTARMGGPDKARPFFQALANDFPQLRRIVGRSIVHTTVDELLSKNSGADEMVVLSKRDGLL